MLVLNPDGLIITWHSRSAELVLLVGLSKNCSIYLLDLFCLLSLDALLRTEKGTEVSADDFFFSNPSAEVVLYKPLKLSSYPLNYGNAKKQAR